MASRVFISGGVFLTIMFIAVLSFSGLEPMPIDPEVLEKKNVDASESLPQLVHNVVTDKNINFAGERVPLEMDDVKERLERELITNAYRHGSTLLAIKNANRYFPYIEMRLRERGMPDDLKYIVAAESDFQNVTSYAGARGFWQIMPAVGRAYGLEQNDFVDERYNIEKSTEAALDLLERYFKRFGNWTNALAAYNCGETAFARDLSQQNEESYYHMNISQETMRYVFRVLAFKSILANPAKYGYYLGEEDLYKQWADTQVVNVDYTISSLADFAKEYNASYRDLKKYNPWLVSSKLPNASKKQYKIVVPITNKE